MASYWIWCFFNLLIVGNVYGEDGTCTTLYMHETCSLEDAPFHRLSNLSKYNRRMEDNDLYLLLQFQEPCKVNVPTMTLAGKPITGEQLIYRITNYNISVVNFETNRPSFDVQFGSLLFISNFNWVNGTTGTAAMYFPYTYTMFAMEAILGHLTKDDLFCFSIIRSSYLCVSFVDGHGIKPPLYFAWHVLIILICYIVALCYPLLIGVFLNKPYYKRRDYYNQSQQEPRLALDSPLPVGIWYTILHWGNTHAWILSIRVFMLCILIIVLSTLSAFFTDTSVFYFKSYIDILQILAFLIITISPATLSVFNDGSDCGLDFDSNRYTCLYRQMLNRFQLVISHNIWGDINNNRSRFNRTINCIYIFCWRLPRYVFPVFYLLLQPIISIFNFVYEIRITGIPQDRPKAYILFYFFFTIIRAFLFTRFVVAISIGVAHIAYLLLQIFLLTTTGILINYAAGNKEAVMGLITILIFGLNILRNFKYYYNTYAAVWRTIVCAAEAWQAGNDRSKQKLNNIKLDSKMPNLFTIRNAPATTKPLVVYMPKEFVPNLPENLFFHIIKKHKNRYLEIGSLLFWNLIFAICLGIAYSTIVSANDDITLFTVVSTYIVTQIIFPNLIYILSWRYFSMMLFATDEYALIQEAEKRRILEEVCNYAEMNGYTRSTAGLGKDEQDHDGDTNDDDDNDTNSDDDDDDNSKRGNSPFY